MNPLQPRLVSVSNSISFANPKAPVYPRLALGKSWDEVSFIYFCQTLAYVFVNSLSELMLRFETVVIGLFY